MKCEQLKHTSIDSICHSPASRWLKADDINSVYDLVIMSTEDFFQVLNRHRMHPNRTRYELHGIERIFNKLIELGVHECLIGDKLEELRQRNVKYFIDFYN